MLKAIQLCKMASLTQISTFLSCLIFIHLVVVLHLIPNTFAQPEFLYYNCTYTANYTNPSTYNTNLNTTLSSLSSNINQYGYYNSSFGQEPDRVTTVALCRGDVELELCRACVDDSISKLRQVCPGQREAIAWYDNCMLRYTNQTIPFGAMEWGPGFSKWSQLFVPDEHLDTFQEFRKTLLLSLRDKAASVDARRKYATGDEHLQNYETVYSLVQCTPDLSESVCSDCINACMEQIPVCCNRSKGAAVYKPTCNLRYNLGNSTFYNGSSPFPSSEATPTPKPPPDNRHPRQAPIGFSAGIFIIIISIVFSSVIFVTFMAYILRKAKKNHYEDEDGDGKSALEFLQYDFATIKVATDNFSDTNKLGQGGFGPVYKGILPNGNEIAVKRLSKESGQGKVEFKTQVLLMVTLQQRNLVRLLGSCLERTEWFLINEFVTNRSLDHFIFDTIKGAELDWDKRYKIIGGIAKGLLYLHEDSQLRIIHGDLKASNILLDSEMNAKIADFGIARCFALDETQGSTSKIAGTYGYMPPEVLKGNISVESDVYSFGVLVLEIVSGQKINKIFRDEENAESLLSYAWKMWQEETALNLIEPTMRYKSGSIDNIMRCIHIGLLCVQENVAYRPNMASVVLMLSPRISFTLPAPTLPAFLLNGSSALEIEMSLVAQTHFRKQKRSQENVSDSKDRLREEEDIWTKHVGSDRPGCLRDMRAGVTPSEFNGGQQSKKGSQERDDEVSRLRKELEASQRQVVSVSKQLEYFFTMVKGMFNHRGMPPPPHFPLHNDDRVLTTRYADLKLACFSEITFKKSEVIPNASLNK